MEFPQEERQRQEHLPASMSVWLEEWMEEGMDAGSAVEIIYK